jgi:PBP1b-binding outer membrane lipoprotein LpoB
MKTTAAVTMLLLILTGCTVSFSPGPEAVLPKPTAGTPSQQAEAIDAARQYLAMIDNHEYDETWEHAGSSLQESTSKFVWTNALKLTSKMLGTSSKRDVEGLGFSTQIDQKVAVGSYVLVQFKSQSGSVTATEKVVMQKEHGLWKIIGYFVTKRADSSAST